MPVWPSLLSPVITLIIKTVNTILLIRPHHTLLVFPHNALSTLSILCTHEDTKWHLGPLLSSDSSGHHTQVHFVCMERRDSQPCTHFRITWGDFEEKNWSQVFELNQNF